MPWHRSVTGAPWWLWPPAVITAALMLVPIVYLVLRAREAGDAVWSLVFRERTWHVLWNTITLSAAVGISTIVIAVPLAWLVVRSDLPGKRFWSVICALPLVIPSYAGALAFIGALGPRGFVQSMLEPLGVERLPSVYGFFGAWLLLTLFTYPYVYLAVRSQIQTLDPAIEEAASSLGRGPVRTFLTITIPRLRTSIAAGVLLAVLYTLSDFGVVTLMRYDAFTRVIYTQYNAAFDRTYAAMLSLILVLMAIILVTLDASVKRNARYHRLGSGAARLPRVVKLGRYRPAAIAFVCAVVGASLIGPIVALIYWAKTGASTNWDTDRLSTSLSNAVQLSLWVALLTTFAAIPIAYLAARYPGWRSELIERLTYLGYALPGIVIALAFVFMGTRILQPIYQTLTLLVIAVTIRLIPESVGSIRGSLTQINPHLEEAARTLGQSSFGALRRITWPLARPGVTAGAALVFLTVMKELPITLLLRPTGFTTLATDIWEWTSTGQYGKSAVSALVLIGISIVPTAFLLGRQPAAGHDDLRR